MDKYLADSARWTASKGQLIFLALALPALAIGLAQLASLGVLMYLTCGLWLVIGCWRLICLRFVQPASIIAHDARVWPRYTLVAALYDEADILPQLVERLSRLDYPADRLQGFLALEADDAATIKAAKALKRPSWLQILIVPDGTPRTKPRALNYALERATGDFITVYDAEDDPDPLQLKEAASRFLSGPEHLVCLQAPLRIRCRDRSKSRSPFLDTQFAVEYGALFEVTLPAMAQMGLPFPLGGTSNHFRVNRLREIGGWDAWNVTEDADLGFRIWRTGGTLGVLARPTYETPPGGLALWLPQRTRWIKGYLQTVLVHTRHGVGMKVRGWLAMGLTLMAALLCASVHAITMAWFAAVTLTAAVAGTQPQLPAMAVFTVVIGTLASLVVAAHGARRASVSFTLSDMMLMPAYWSLLTLAFVHAFTRLVLEPHRWDKTPHRPEIRDHDEQELIANAGRQAA